ncbi:MAG TPA: YMGG-like glycine zipper-containing protein [Pyrinomonadaceae bacterium]|jgi:hypothetical protein|nr:YMGG-like glycine zipper-containing protein [Pyrinomonadaceae bacterium]
MDRVRSICAVLLLTALACTGLTAQTQRRRRPQMKASRAVARTDTRLTGLYRLDAASSDDPQAAAGRVAQTDAFGTQSERTEQLIERLTSPEQLAIERRARLVSIASSRAPRISFEADGQDHTERAADGHTVRTRASLTESSLLVNSSSVGNDLDDSYSVSFDSLEDGRRLRVTRRIYGQQYGQAVVVQSIYNKISNAARFDIYQPQGERVANIARNTPPASQNNNRRGVARTGPPTIRHNPPPPSQPAQTNPPVSANDVYVLVVPDNTRVVAVLNSDLGTATAHEGDRFTLTVREPGAYAGATIEGYVSRVQAGGKLSGRAEMTLNFEQIRLSDGRTAGFNGIIEDVRATGGEDVRVNSEGGNVQETDSQGGRTAQRAAIGAAVGAIIGAIAKGGKGAAIGAAIGAGAGVGSVYAQGRDELQLRNGTELIIRASRTK